MKKDDKVTWADTQEAREMAERFGNGLFSVMDVVDVADIPTSRGCNCTHESYFDVPHEEGEYVDPSLHEHDEGCTFLTQEDSIEVLGFEQWVTVVVRCEPRRFANRLFKVVET